MLKEENNIPLLDQFLRKFNDNFMTTYKNLPLSRQMARSEAV